MLIGFLCRGGIFHSVSAEPGSVSGEINNSIILPCVGNVDWQTERVTLKGTLPPKTIATDRLTIKQPDTENNLTGSDLTAELNFSTNNYEISGSMDGLLKASEEETRSIWIFEKQTGRKVFRVDLPSVDIISAPPENSGSEKKSGPILNIFAKGLLPQFTVNYSVLTKVNDGKDLSQMIAPKRKIRLNDRSYPRIINVTSTDKEELSKLQIEFSPQKNAQENVVHQISLQNADGSESRSLQIIREEGQIKHSRIYQNVDFMEQPIPTAVAELTAVPSIELLNVDTALKQIHQAGLQPVVIDLNTLRRVSTEKHKELVIIRQGLAPHTQVRKGSVLLLGVRNKTNQEPPAQVELTKSESDFLSSPPLDVDDDLGFIRTKIMSSEFDGGVVNLARQKVPGSEDGVFLNRKMLDLLDLNISPPANSQNPVNQNEIRARKWQNSSGVIRIGADPGIFITAESLTSDADTASDTQKTKETTVSVSRALKQVSAEIETLRNRLEDIPGGSAWLPFIRADQVENAITENRSSQQTYELLRGVREDLKNKDDLENESQKQFLEKHFSQFEIALDNYLSIYEQVHLNDLKASSAILRLVLEALADRGFKQNNPGALGKLFIENIRRFEDSNVFALQSQGQLSVHVDSMVDEVITSLGIEGVTPDQKAELASAWYQQHKNALHPFHIDRNGNDTVTDDILIWIIYELFRSQHFEPESLIRIAHGDRLHVYAVLLARPQGLPVDLADTQKILNIGPQSNNSSVTVKPGSTSDLTIAKLPTVDQEMKVNRAPDKVRVPTDLKSSTVQYAIGKLSSLRLRHHGNNGVQPLSTDIVTGVFPAEKEWVAVRTSIRLSVERKVPDIAGKKWTAGLQDLKNSKLTSSIANGYKAGSHIYSTFPEGNKTLDPRKLVIIYPGSKVPSVVNRQLPDARQILTDSGFKHLVTQTRNRPTNIIRLHNSELVESQSPAKSDTIWRQGKAVELSLVRNVAKLPPSGVTTVRRVFNEIPQYFHYLVTGGRNSTLYIIKDSHGELKKIHIARVTERQIVNGIEYFRYQITWTVPSAPQQFHRATKQGVYEVLFPSQGRGEISFYSSGEKLPHYKNGPPTGNARAPEKAPAAALKFKIQDFLRKDNQ